ncbi:penicillin-binding protein 2 [Bordetella pertussis]|nr:penicillin-binding protein 2 [Bordetella pertussis]
MEAQGLQGSRSPALVCRRNDFRGGRAGLQLVHAAAIGAGHLDPGQQRPVSASAPGARDSRLALGLGQPDRDRARLPHPAQAGERRRDQARHGGRGARRHGAARLRRRALPGRRQDRHRAGVQPARRPVSRQRHRRAPAGPRLVHGVRAGRAAAHRRGPDRGERRLGASAAAPIARTLFDNWLGRADAPSVVRAGAKPVAAEPEAAALELGATDGPMQERRQ